MKRAALPIMLTGIIAALLLCLSVPAWSQSSGSESLRLDWSRLNEQPKVKAPAQPFYQRCLAGSLPSAAADDQVAMCACMDAHHGKYVAQKEANDWRAKLDRRTDMTDLQLFNITVVGPCMFLMSKNVSDKACDTPRTRRMFHDNATFARYCACREEGVEKYLEEYGPALLPVLHSEGINIDDPLRAVTGSMDFRRYIADSDQACMRKFYSANPPKKSTVILGDYNG